MRKKKIRVEEGSGNVFADLGLPNPEQELLKARLTLQIYKIVKARGARWRWWRGDCSPRERSDMQARC